MAEVLNIEERTDLGKRNSRRLRQAGKLPAVLYGHGKEAIHLSIPTVELERALRHGSKVCELKGKVNENAIIRELQWDTFSVDVLHVDLLRVRADERVIVSVALATRGVAPGSKEGGVVQLSTHEVEVETLATAVPEILHLNVNSLEAGGTLTAGDIEDLPQGAKLMIDESKVLVQCIVTVEDDEDESDLGSVEPELIGRKAESEEGESS